MVVAERSVMKTSSQTQAVVHFLSEVPMEVWKRVATYPGLLWVLFEFFVPCRVTPRLTVTLLGLTAFGIVGACIHLSASSEER
jgi:hypothetical protein